MQHGAEYGQSQGGLRRFTATQNIGSDGHTSHAALLAHIHSLGTQVFVLQKKIIEKQTKDPDKYYFPAEIAEEIGYSANYINNLRRHDCHFHGRKTTIRSVRECLLKMAEAPALQQLSSPLY